MGSNFSIYEWEMSLYKIQKLGKQKHQNMENHRQFGSSESFCFVKSVETSICVLTFRLSDCFLYLKLGQNKSHRHFGLQFVVVVGDREFRVLNNKYRSIHKSHFYSQFVWVFDECCALLPAPYSLRIFDVHRCIECNDLPTAVCNKYEEREEQSLTLNIVFIYASVQYPLGNPAISLFIIRSTTHQIRVGISAISITHAA